MLLHRDFKPNFVLDTNTNDLHCHVATQACLGLGLLSFLGLGLSSLSRLGLSSFLELGLSSFFP